MVLNTLKKDMEKIRKGYKTLELIYSRKRVSPCSTKCASALREKDANVRKEIAEVSDLVENKYQDAK
jgi:hypothetical protein